MDFSFLSIDINEASINPSSKFHGHQTSLFLIKSLLFACFVTMSDGWSQCKYWMWNFNLMHWHVPKGNGALQLLPEGRYRNAKYTWDDDMKDWNGETCHIKKYFTIVRRKKFLNCFVHLLNDSFKILRGISMIYARCFCMIPVPNIYTD